MSDQLPREAFPATTDETEEEVELTPEQQERLARKEEQQRILQHRAELLVEFSKTDQYRMIAAEYAGKRERMHKSFADRLLAGEAVDQRQVDYDRGFIDGLGYLEQMMTGAQNVLKRLDREAEKEETDSDSEDERGVW